MLIFGLLRRSFNSHRALEALEAFRRMSLLILRSRAGMTHRIRADHIGFDEMLRTWHLHMYFRQLIRQLIELANPSLDRSATSSVPSWVAMMTEDFQIFRELAHESLVGKVMHL